MIWRVSGMLLLVVLLAGEAGAQTDWDKVEMEILPVAGNVYLVQSVGGNIGVSAGEDGYLLVDDKYAQLADRIRALAGDLGKDSLTFVLNTHWHRDHTSGNLVLGSRVPIIAHTNTRRRLSMTQELTRQVYEPFPKTGLPVITFEDSLSIHFNGEEIRAFHLPRGHTDGDVVVFFTISNVYHVGDLMFAERFPFVDLETGGDVAGYIRNVENLIERIPQDAKIIPGHGPLSTLSDLTVYLQMLIASTLIVREWMDEGMTLEECQAEGLGEPLEEYSWSFITTERWIKTIFESYSRDLSKERKETP